MEQRNTIKLRPDYFEWCLLFAIDLSVALFWIWIIKKGFDWEAHRMIDLTGPFMALIGFILLAWAIYELKILVDFLRVEAFREISYDKNSFSFIISIRGQDKRLELRDLKEVVFSSSRWSNRTPTAHLSYSELIFKEDKRLFITSFVKNVKAMEKFLEGRSYKKTYRSRGLFEGITVNKA